MGGELDYYSARSMRSPKDIKTSYEIDMKKFLWVGKIKNPQLDPDCTKVLRDDLTYRCEPLVPRAEIMLVSAAAPVYLNYLLLGLALLSVYSQFQIVKLPKLASRSCLLSLRSYQLADR